MVRFDERRDRTATMDEARGTVKLAGVSESRIEVEACGRCHARRGLLTEEYRPGRPLAQTHLPALLDEGLYYADGQMRDEVYNWGSFLQSRMYAAGVTCSDCHDPHSARLRARPDAVCATCHHPEKFETRRHHFHREQGAGASCVGCHMRRETYMVVDARHDHSFRVPRPDLTVALGRENAPNACNDCHRDRSAAWAARAVRRAYPAGRQTRPHYATALQAGRRYGPGAEAALLAVVRDPAVAGIVRGTAVSLLPPHMGPESLPALEAAAKDADALVRLGTARAVEALPARERVRIGARLLWDPVRAVRVEAASAFADVPDAELESEARAAFDRALDEYRLAQRANAERPEAHVNLGIVNVKRGDLDTARRDYDQAIALAPWFVPAWINLADLLRIQGREEEGAAALRRALEVDPRNAAAHHAYGLLLVRQKRMPEALAELGRAAELSPEAPDFAYTYAIGLHSTGRTDEALGVLRRASARNPGARNILVALVTINRERGALGEARRYAARLVAAAPADPAARALAEGLGRRSPVSPDDGNGRERDGGYGRRTSGKTNNEPTTKRTNERKEQTNDRDVGLSGLSVGGLSAPRPPLEGIFNPEQRGDVVAQAGAVELEEDVEVDQQPAGGVPLEAGGGVGQVVGLGYESDLGEGLAVGRRERLLDEPRRIDHVGPQEVEREREALQRRRCPCPPRT